MQKNNFCLFNISKVSKTAKYFFPKMFISKDIALRATSFL